MQKQENVYNAMFANAQGFMMIQDTTCHITQLGPVALAVSLQSFDLESGLHCMHREEWACKTRVF